MGVPNDSGFWKLSILTSLPWPGNPVLLHSMSVSIALSREVAELAAATVQGRKKRKRERELKKRECEGEREEEGERESVCVSVREGETERGTRTKDATGHP